ncbi:hypothetical protein BT93_L0127 [Corymbia citriodora subsp. variegata]|uniref:TIR domain-containing protein n=1 Tax=Corymbia citriodora subsp. variegata TaxID=360336 RepID=A0A8T0CQL7_CORYI|nr:hypothetical protein BT93_L0127 [Corymbia citriodora subsp. variegata]
MAMATAALASSGHDGGLGRGHEVFLSFRGPDTRLTIADSLYEAIKRAAIHVFKDDEELRVGKEIGVKLSRDNDEKIILPIFYDVDADDVKLKTKLYRTALQKHESDYGKDITKQWEEALREVARIKGWNLKDYCLNKLTYLMVEEVSNLLWTRRTDMPNHLVGIKDQMDRIMKLLDLGAFDVWFIVIHDVQTNDMINLQKKLLSDVLHLNCANFSFIDEGADLIKTRFHGKKVPVVLDDINGWDQIMRLTGEPNWFGRGSRIIITRNIEFLVKEGEDDNIPASSSRQFSFYDTPEMNSHDALQLFCERALGRAKPPPDYKDIMEKLIYALGGLPLALNVVGSTLRGKCRSTWENTLCKLKKVMNEDVKKKLMISYEALEPNQQQIYLDIACFYINKEKTIAVKYWDAIFGYSTEIEINILKRMSLIKIFDDDKLWMQDQLRDQRRNIVHLENGTKDIVGLNLETPDPNKTYKYKRKKFVGLVNLRFLQLDHGNFEGDFKNIFFEKTPKFSTIFQLEKLILRCTQLKQIDKSIGNVQHLDYLEIRSEAIESLPKSIDNLKSLMVLRIDKRLSVLPHSISNSAKVKHLILSQRELQKLPNSIGQLKKVPNSIGRLQSLVKLDLSRSRIRSLPDCIGNLKMLKVLNLNDSRIRMLKNLKELLAHSDHLEGEIPSEIGALSSLKVLDLSGGRLSGLPTTINQLTKLHILYLLASDSIQHLLELPKSLKFLAFSSKSLTAIPDFSNLTNLFHLCIRKTSVQEEPKIEGIVRLHALRRLILCIGKKALPPTDFSSLSQLQYLNISYVDSQSLTKLPSSLQYLALKNIYSPIDWSIFSNLKNLSRLFIGGYLLGEIQFKVLEKLQKFNELTMSNNTLLKTLPFYLV